ncbi:MAG TPA: hypothetical protein VGV93_00560 [Acidimicrobiales bacterium]|nr:hypothetical protein [Acidimicrobiales bacterium]
MRPVGDDQPAEQPPTAVVHHVLGRFGLSIAKLYGGSNAGAYVAVPIGLVQLSMTIDDHPSGDLYDVYNWEDEIYLEGDLEVQVFHWAYSLPSSIAVGLWPALVTDPRSGGGPHWPLRPAHRPVYFYLTTDFGRDMHAVTEATGMTREEMLEQAVFDTAEHKELLDLLEGRWARRRLRARRGAEPIIGRDDLSPWHLGRRANRISPGEVVAVSCWPGYPPVELRAAPACAGEDTPQGVWLCVVHNRELRRAGDMERHTFTADDADHLLAWLCSEHGLEAPP